MQKKRGNKKIWGVYFLFVFGLFFGGYRQYAMAQEASVIKVGYYPLDHYHTKDETGNIVGYEVEYLSKIAEMTGWKYEYIAADSWNDALNMLRNHEVDLISPSQMVSGRLDEFLFSAIPAGRVYGAVVTKNSRDDLVYEDFDTFENLTFGVELGTSYKALFEEYAENNHFTPHIVEYRNFGALEEGLEEGNVDAIIINIMRTKEDTKLLAKFGATSYYFMMNKKDTKLAKQLNEAMARIELEFPDFQNRLVKTYFPIYNQQPLTIDEMDFVKEVKILRVGCPVNLDPLSYLDENGKIDGITRDILDSIADSVYLKFVYVPLPNGEISYDDIRELNLDIISCVEYNQVNINSKGMRLTLPYLNSQKVVIGRKDQEFNWGDELSIGVVSGSKTLETVLKSEYPNFTVVRYNTVEECMDAVLKQELDLMIQNQYAVEPYLDRPKYEELHVIPSEGVEDHMCLSFVVAKEGVGTESELLSDKRLLSVLNKGISNMPDEVVSQMIINQTLSRTYEPTLEDFYYRYRIALLPLTVLLIVGLFMTARVRILEKRNLEMLRKNEYKLKNITNNINGGVVVLLPSEGLQIRYANDGFLQLMKYTKDEYDALMEQDYIMYIHPEDIEQMQREVERNAREYDQISMRLRILRKDGKYIPTMFNATIAKDEEGHRELYCVVLDISREMEMLDQLAFEQEKHNLLLEKSEAIMFEIDWECGILRVSDAFLNKFGWTFPAYISDISCERLLKHWRVEAEDLDALRAMFERSIEKREDASCRVRMQCISGDSRWCEVSQFVMHYKDTGKVMFIGKIEDINDEVKSLERWKAKSQYDSLTGLYHKKSFADLGKEYLQKHPKDNTALVFIDLDHFKSVNDKLGHLTGDQAIQDAAKKLQELFDEQAVLARFGGDEFCAMLFGITEEDLEKKLGEAVERLRQTYEGEQEAVTITGSIGAATTQRCGYEFEELMDYADQALYEGKEGGRDQFVIYRSSKKL